MQQSEKTVDFILDALAQGNVTEEWAIEFCRCLYTFGHVLDLDRLREKNPVLWSKLEQEISSHYGSYDFRADRYRDLADMFVAAKDAGCFSYECLAELYRGLGEWSVQDPEPRHARELFDALTRAMKVVPVDDEETQQELQWLTDRAEARKRGETPQPGPYKNRSKER